MIGYGVNYDGTHVRQRQGRDGGHGAADQVLGAVDRAVRHGVLPRRDLFPAWKGSLFVGALAGQMLVRLTLDGEKVTGEERLLQGMRERIRDVRVGP